MLLPIEVGYELFDGVLNQTNCVPYAYISMGIILTLFENMLLDMNLDVYFGAFVPKFVDMYGQNHTVGWTKMHEWFTT